MKETPVLMIKQLMNPHLPQNNFIQTTLIT